VVNERLKERVKEVVYDRIQERERVKEVVYERLKGRELKR
jgi:hypothetical protein